MGVEVVAADVCGRTAIRSMRALHLKPNIFIVLRSIHTDLRSQNPTIPQPVPFNDPPHTTVKELNADE